MKTSKIILSAFLMATAVAAIIPELAAKDDISKLKTQASSHSSDLAKNNQEAIEKELTSRYASILQDIDTDKSDKSARKYELILKDYTKMQQLFNELAAKVEKAMAFIDETNVATQTYLSALKQNAPGKASFKSTVAAYKQSLDDATRWSEAASAAQSNAKGMKELAKKLRDTASYINGFVGKIKGFSDNTKDVYLKRMPPEDWKQAKDWFANFKWKTDI